MSLPKHHLVSPDLSPEALRERDREWVAEIRRGNERAFEAMFHTYYRPLSAFAYGFVKSRDSAEEVVQTVFVAIWRSHAQWDVRSSIRTYLFRAVRNQALKVLKHLHVERRFAEGELDDEVPPGMSQRLQMIDDLLDEKAREEVLRLAIAQLPPRGQLVLALRWEHGMSYEEIAAIMGITPTSAKIAKSRALEALRRLLPHDLR
jgi:RNA polymerase sigma-70 factor (ECF subfamily)